MNVEFGTDTKYLMENGCVITINKLGYSVGAHSHAGYYYGKDGKALTEYGTDFSQLTVVAVADVAPTEAERRKAMPVATGFVDYFPDAIREVAILSRVGNDQHNPGKPLHWDRSKSGDESDALMRHFLERGTIDTDGVRHSAKVAWRAMALLQKEIEGAK